MGWGGGWAWRCEAFQSQRKKQKHGNDWKCWGGLVPMLNRVKWGVGWRQGKV